MFVIEFNKLVYKLHLLYVRPHKVKKSLFTFVKINDLKYYFSLQWLRLSRWFEEQGINPWLGVLLSIVGFLGVSKLLFYKLDVAGWVYVGIALYTLSQLSSRERNGEMQRMASRKSYRRWRILENVGYMSPFVIFLLYEKAMWEALVLAGIGIMMSLFVMRTLVVRTIPSPFRRIPFEGIVGFRLTIIVFLVIYLLLIPAIGVGNFNLGLVSLIATYLIQLSFYLNPEKEYFVWIFSLSIEKFLKKKWLNAQFVALVLSLPFALILVCFFPDKWMLILGAILVGHLWVSAGVFSKYGVYPKEMNVAQGFIMALGIIVFPLLGIFIPLYIKRSKEKLRLYLK